MNIEHIKEVGVSGQKRGFSESTSTDLAVDTTTPPVNVDMGINMLSTTNHDIQMIDQTDTISRMRYFAELRAKTHGFSPESGWKFSTVANDAGINMGTYTRDQDVVADLWVTFLTVMKERIDSSALKYTSMPTFLEEYPHFVTYPTEEQAVLLLTANWMAMMLTMVPSNKNKGLIMQVVPQLVEGPKTKYITGSGQTDATSCRVYIFEKESGLNPRVPGPPRKPRSISPRTSHNKSALSLPGGTEISEDDNDETSIDSPYSHIMEPLRARLPSNGIPNTVWRWLAEPTGKKIVPNKKRTTVTSKLPTPNPNPNPNPSVDKLGGSFAPMTVTGTPDVDLREYCNCRKSRCLKLYCQCFATSAPCTAECSCSYCANKPTHEALRQKRKTLIMQRNPTAFSNKFETAQIGRGKEAPIMPIAHKIGCRCKKSHCLKKYCECFHAKVHCNATCLCSECLNTGTIIESQSSARKPINTVDPAHRSAPRPPQISSDRPYLLVDQKEPHSTAAGARSSGSSYGDADGRATLRGAFLSREHAHSTQAGEDSETNTMEMVVVDPMRENGESLAQPKFLGSAADEIASGLPTAHRRAAFLEHMGESIESIKARMPIISIGTFNQFKSTVESFERNARRNMTYVPIGTAVLFRPTLREKLWRPATVMNFSDDTMHIALEYPIDPILPDCPLRELGIQTVPDAEFASMYIIPSAPEGFARGWFWNSPQTVVREEDMGRRVVVDVINVK